MKLFTVHLTMQWFVRWGTGHGVILEPRPSLSLARSARLMSPGTSHLELITTLPYPTAPDPSRGVFGKTYRSHLSV